MTKLLMLARLRKDAYSEVVKLYEEVTRMPLVIDKRRDPFYIEGRKVGRREGRQEGMKRWLQQGIQQGLLKDAQEMVLEVVEVKLGRVPKLLQEQIKAETDREKLKKLHRELILATNPIEVIQRFGYRVNEA
ncbi:MAG: hypothetical protein N3C57_05875 [Aquificaceae bacterium]|nr:hypothetical protein [Aquificaceae bacterium]